MWEQHLVYAAGCSTKQILEYLVFKSENNLHVKVGGKHLIHYAAENGNVEILQYLLEEGVSVNLQDELGETALSRATAYYLTFSKGIEAVKYLISKGADINISNCIDFIRNPNTEEKIILHNIFFKTQISCEEKDFNYTTFFANFSQYNETEILDEKAKKDSFTSRGNNLSSTLARFSSSTMLGSQRAYMSII